MQHTYYTTCPYCGAHLDPGERCDCPRASPGGYQYGNQMGAKNAPMQKVHRCRLCTRTCPACRRSYLAAASSSLPPAQNDPRQFAGDTSCILQPVAFCNCCSTTKRKPLTLLAQRGRQMGGKVSRQYRPHYIKNGGFYNAWLYCISIIYRGPVRAGLLLWCRCDVVQRHPVRGWAI